MTDVDPFDPGVPRGRYGRPLIIPATKTGKPNLKAPLVEYDRASTVAKALDDGGALAKWLTRHAALGIAWSPDLAQLIAALGRDLADLDGRARGELDAIIERAHDRSGGNRKADHGTAVHSLTEPGNTGDALTDDVARDVVSYLAAIDDAGIEVVETETFVVNDELKVAGSFDHAYRFTKDVVVKVNGDEVTIAAGSKLIGDKKTGSLHFDAHAIQLAIYARAKKYNHVTGEREALGVSPQWGVIAHIDREGVVKDGKRVAAKSTLYLVNLHDGWEGAKVAVAARAYKLGVKKRVAAAFATYTHTVAAPAEPVVEAAPVEPDDGDYQAGGPADPGAPVEPVVEDADPILDAIKAAATRDACTAVWQANHLAWQPRHTDAVKERLAQLEDDERAALALVKASGL